MRYLHIFRKGVQTYALTIWAHVFGVIIIHISRSVWVGCGGSCTSRSTEHQTIIQGVFHHFKYLKSFPLRTEHSLISLGWNLCVGFCSAWTTHSGSRHLSAQAIRQNRVLIKVDVRIRAAHSTETPQCTGQFTHMTCYHCSLVAALYLHCKKWCSSSVIVCANI